MKSKGIKNLLIDLGGVLVNLDRQRCICLLYTSDAADDGLCV